MVAEFSRLKKKSCDVSLKGEKEFYLFFSLSFYFLISKKIKMSSYSSSYQSSSGGGGGGSYSSSRGGGSYRDNRETSPRRSSRP